MKKKIVSLILIISAVLSLSYQASAYVTTGVKWPSLYISYYDDASSGTENATAWETAASRWSASTHVSLLKVEPRNENIYCTSQYNSDVSWDGLSEWYYSGSYMTGCTSNLNTYYTDGYSENKRRSVAAHEMGHALGLGDLDDSARALMNGYTSHRYDSYGIYTPQSDDISGVNSLY